MKKGCCPSQGDQFQGHDKIQAGGTKGSRQEGSDAKHIEVIELTGWAANWMWGVRKKRDFMMTWWFRSWAIDRVAMALTKIWNSRSTWITLRWDADANSFVIPEAEFMLHSSVWTRVSEVYFISHCSTHKKASWWVSDSYTDYLHVRWAFKMAKINDFRAIQCTVLGKVLYYLQI